MISSPAAQTCSASLAVPKVKMNPHARHSWVQTSFPSIVRHEMDVLFATTSKLHCTSKKVLHHYLIDMQMRSGVFIQFSLFTSRRFCFDQEVPGAAFTQFMMCITRDSLVKVQKLTTTTVYPVLVESVTGHKRS